MTSAQAIHPQAEGVRKPCGERRARSDYVAALPFVQSDVFATWLTIE
jgi:hypothetical protein